MRQWDYLNPYTEQNQEKIRKKNVLNVQAPLAAIQSKPELKLYCHLLQTSCANYSLASTG